MDKDFHSALLEASLTSFTNEILQIQMAVSKMEMDMIRKCQGKSKRIESHSDVIKLCRKGIQKCDEILKDVKGYFIDLKIFPAYEMFESIFRLLAYFNKIISESYLFRYNNEKSRSNSAQNKLTDNVAICNCMINNKKTKYKLERIDYELSMMQRQQLLILSEMEKLQKNLCMDKDKIQQITCDKKNIAFGELQNTFNEISLKTQNIINTLFRNNQAQLQFTAMIPQGSDLQYQIQQNIKAQYRHLFPKCLKKIINLMINHLKQKNLIRNRKFLSSYDKAFVKNQQKQAINCTTKTVRRSLMNNQDNSDQQQGLNNQLVNQIKKLKKQIQNKDKQINKCKELNKQIQQKLRVSENQYRNIEKMFKKRTADLEQVKAELSWNNRMQAMNKQKQSKQLAKTKKIRKITQKPQTNDQYTEVNQQQICKTNENQSHDFQSLVEESRIMKWNKKHNKRQKYEIRQKQPNKQITIRNLVEKMNQILKVKDQTYLGKDVQSQNIDEIIIKWKKGIDSQIQRKSNRSVKRKSNTPQKKDKNKKKSVNQHKAANTRNSHSTKNRNKRFKKQDHIIDNKKQRKSIGIQTINYNPKPKIYDNGPKTQRSQLLKTKHHQKTLSQPNLFPQYSDFHRKKHTKIRGSLDQKQQQQKQITIKRTDQQNSLLRFSSNLESINQNPNQLFQKQKIAFEGLNFGKIVENSRNDKQNQFSGYLRQKSKRGFSTKDSSKKRWKQILQKKKKQEPYQRNQDILFKMQNLDFNIWSIKIQEFIKWTKQTDIKKYQKFTFDILNQLSNKIGIDIIDKVYQKYLQGNQNILDLEK